MMEKNNTNIRNAIVTFVIPLRLERKTIYGMVFNKDTKYSVDDYVCYLTAAQDFISNGGVIKDNKNTWSYGEYNIKLNDGLKNLIGALYINQIRYMVDYFDEQIQYTDEEVDEECFILSAGLIERYTAPLYQAKPVSNDEEIGLQD